MAVLWKKHYNKQLTQLVVCLKAPISGVVLLYVEKCEQVYAMVQIFEKAVSAIFSKLSILLQALVSSQNGCFSVFL